MILKSNEKTDINMSELTVEIDAESFEKALEAAYQYEKKNISLPGFRKGKVPRKMCENAFGENVFYEQAINMVLNMEMYSVIAESGMLQRLSCCLLIEKTEQLLRSYVLQSL